MQANMRKYVIGCLAIHDKAARLAAARELARFVRQGVEEAAESRDSDALEDVVLALDEIVREITSMWRDMPAVLNVGNVDKPSGGSS